MAVRGLRVEVLGISEVVRAGSRVARPCRPAGGHLRHQVTAWKLMRLMLQLGDVSFLAGVAVAGARSWTTPPTLVIGFPVDVRSLSSCRPRMRNGSGLRRLGGALGVLIIRTMGVGTGGLPVGVPIVVIGRYP